jgi:hypothetical protein
LELDTVSGPKELIATDESGQKVRYVFKDGRYQQFPAPGAAKPPLVPQATTLNNEGMRLMQQKEYKAATAKFERASESGDFGPTSAQFKGWLHRANPHKRHQMRRLCDFACLVAKQVPLLLSHGYGCDLFPRLCSMVSQR